MSTARGLGAANVVPLNALVGHAPDPDTARATLAIVVAILPLRFRLSAIKCDGTELYLRRFCGPHVDLMLLRSDVDLESICTRHDRRRYPWPKGTRPEVGRRAYGSIVDVVRQVRDWPTF